MVNSFDLLMACHREAAGRGDPKHMDCRVAALLSMNSPVIVKVAVIANPSTGSGQAAVKQSMTSDCMDCRALACPEFIEGLAVTKFLFKVVCGIGSDSVGSQ
jgi:hypothetical protein